MHGVGKRRFVPVHVTLAGWEHKWCKWAGENAKETGESCSTELEKVQKHVKDHPKVNSSLQDGWPHHGKGGW